MIIRSAVAALSLSLVLATPASAAEEFLFNCRNDWNQSVLVTVTADSEKDARKALKNPPYSKDYSLCTLRGRKPAAPQILPEYDEEEDERGPDGEVTEPSSADPDAE